VLSGTLIPASGILPNGKHSKIILSHMDRFTSG
jgi:hypothetical protein